MAENIEQKVIVGFGDEWERFDQSKLTEAEHREIFENYFNVFPWDQLPENSEGFDLGCGSGRWAKMVAPRVGKLHLIDPSKAIEVSRRNLSEFSNCEFHQASVDEIPLEDGSCDFGYSLGVLHHVEDTEGGLKSCVAKLKPSAPFLLYLYYRFDNRPLWFRLIWKCSDLVRQVVSKLPSFLRFGISQVLAVFVYFPLAKLSWLLEKMGVNVESVPLSQYRKYSFYTMRTDALDRFGTRLEKRYTKVEMQEMMERAGLESIRFCESSFWTAVGFKK